MKNPIQFLSLSSGAKHMLLATFYFAVMNIFIKAVTHFPVMEIVFFRCGISLLICMYQLHKEGISSKGTNKKLLLLRGIFGTTSLYAYFITIAHMPLGTAVTIQYLSPVFTAILAIVVLGEKIKPVQWIFFGVSFAGIVVMKGLDSRIEITYLLIGVFSAIVSAFAYITIRSLKEMEHPLVVVFHFQLVGTIAGLIFSVGNFDIPTGIDWLYLLLIGIFTQFGQVHLTKAFQRDKAAKVSILIYSGVIYAIAAGFFIFGETYSLATLGGIFMVVAGLILSVLFRQ